MIHKSYPFIGHLVTKPDELPVPPPAALLGREELRAEVDDQLDQNDVVLLHGPEGIGKTTVASAATALWTGAKSRPAVWINANDDEVGVLCDQIGQAFDSHDVIDAPSPQIQIDRTRALLNTQQPMIVLDNATSAQSAREFVRRVISGLPVLITSRDQLPGPWTPLQVKSLSRQAAVSLFYQQSGLEPNDQINDIMALCSAIEDHPLSIVLSGRLVALDKKLTPKILAGALPSQYDLPPGASLVQAILRVVFKRLSSIEQAVLMVLGGTFAGGGTPGFLASIADLDQGYVERAINRMSTRGLLYKVKINDRDCTTMHKLVFVFARDLLDGAGRLAEAKQRTVKAVAAYAAQHADDDVALHAEWGNILGALDQATDNNNAKVISAIAEAVANSRLLTINGHARLHEQMGAVGSARLEPPTPEPAPVEAQEAEPAQTQPGTSTKPNPTKSEWPGHEFVASGDRHIQDDNPQAAIESYAQAFQLAQQNKNAQMMARVLVKLGRASDLAGAYDDALQSYRQAMQIAQQVRDTATQAEALASLGAAFMAMGRLEKAVNAYERAAPALEATGQGVLLARTYNNFGLALMEQGEVEQALEKYEMALKAARSVGDPASECDALIYAGDVYREDQQYDEALERYRQALRAAEQAEDRRLEEQAIGALGIANLERGNAEQAVENLERALSISQQLGAEARERDWVGYLAQVYTNLGRYDEAAASYARAVELARESGDRFSEAAYLNDMGLLLTWRGDWERAIELYEQAIEIAREIDAHADEAVFLSNLGMVYMDMGKAETALEYFKPALEIGRDLGDLPQEANALGNMGVAYGALGKWPDALGCHTQALKLARETDDLYEQSHHLGNIGRIQKVLDMREEAIDSFRAALNISYRLGDDEGKAAWLYHLGSLLMDDIRQLAEAVSMLQEAYEIRLDRDHHLTEETARRLSRAEKRLNRASKRDLAIVPPQTPEQRQQAAIHAAEPVPPDSPPEMPSDKPPPPEM